MDQITNNQEALAAVQKDGCVLEFVPDPQHFEKVQAGEKPCD